MKRIPIDQSQRREALDPTQSYIVQAPAGSGKTSLLVKRFLILLSRVERPEEILAITFTRKATAEMKVRILEALIDAKKRQYENLPQDDGNDAELLGLGLAALANDVSKGWDLTNNPTRLRIQTIDAFCYELIRHMPWSSRFGAAPLIVEDAQSLYMSAAKQTLDHIEGRSQWAPYCKNLLQLVDANFGKCQLLLRTMLEKRDRWMRGLPTGDRKQFESMWQSVIAAELAIVEQQLSPGMKQEIASLADGAATRLAATKPDHAFVQCAGVKTFPPPSSDNLPYWQGIASLFLTQKNELRATVTKNLGFPPEEKAAKKQMLSLLQALGEIPELVDGLATIQSLPNGYFSHQQWLTLESLLKLLPLAAAELRLLFKARNQTDYVELTQRAETALGTAENPTDLALSFDYRLQHILIDEFQDTSKSQIDLLLKLTAGWQDHDGHTLFLVGDPMQSIYRFREAEVGHFLEVQQHGLGQIHPIPLSLQSNFRSAPTLVDWFNQTFKRVFPTQDDIVNSAVKYSLACSHRDTDLTSEAFFHSEADASRDDEAVAICRTVESELAQFPDQQIAILGRSRTHLLLIAQALRKANIPFGATDLETMGQHTTIADLISLTRAILQPADRIAWLSVLRAPWCGLSLGDLSLLTGGRHQTSVVELLHSPAIVASLSDNAKHRIERLKSALMPSLKTRRRVPLRHSVESAWLNLMSPVFVPEKHLDDCNLFFELLEQLEAEHQFITASLLQDTVNSHWTQNTTQANVQLLTIHKAKGLEFDTVILPGLERIPRHQERELLRWARLPEQLLIALLPASGEEDKSYRFLGELDKFHQRNELCRLLYVACTRARRRLHLFATLKTDRKGETKPPPVSSLLHLLWPVWPDRQAALDPGDTHNPQHNDTHTAAVESRAPGMLARLPLNFVPPFIEPDLSFGSPELVSESPQIEFSWASESARIIGIVIHQLLAQIGDMGWQRWHRLDTSQMLNQSRASLIENGLDLKDMDHGISQVNQAINNLQSDTRAHWIFSDKHHQARAEWSLTCCVNDAFTTVILDRSFIDDNGVRWIIDFKSSRHEDSDVDQFVTHEKQRYQAQLNKYANVLSQMETRETQLGLYFPLLKAWTHWPSPYNG